VSTIAVDLDGLRTLAARLSELRIRLALDGRGDLADHCRDPLVAMALQDVQDDWSRKRRAISAYLESAADAVDAAAAAYTAADQAVDEVAQVGR
jgi:hypothetical protein